VHWLDIFNSFACSPVVQLYLHDEEEFNVYKKQRLIYIKKSLHLALVHNLMIYYSLVSQGLLKRRGLCSMQRKDDHG